MCLMLKWIYVVMLPCALYHSNFCVMTDFCVMNDCCAFLSNVHPTPVPVRAQSTAAVFKKFCCCCSV